VKVCSSPGCPTLTRTTYCRKHTRDKRRASDRRRPNARQRGYDSHWRKTRSDFLRTYPVCQHPEGCLAPATDVHHLDGQGPKGPQGHDWLNLQGLCHSHHSQATAREQPGGFNA
jgi:5-methylcytosine-specific restriction protein A